MGQKVHPLGFRLGITQKYNACWFANPEQYPQYILEDFLLRQSLSKMLPAENLPVKQEDTGETRIVNIKIERFIRNTIKIKIYAVNAENFLKSQSSLALKALPRKSFNNSSFKNKNEQNFASFSKGKNFGNSSRLDKSSTEKNSALGKKQGVQLFLDRNKANNSKPIKRSTLNKKRVTQSNILSKYVLFLNKKLKKLQRLKILNLIYKFEILLKSNHKELISENTPKTNKTQKKQEIKQIIAEITRLKGQIVKIERFINKKLVLSSLLPVQSESLSKEITKEKAVNEQKGGALKNEQKIKLSKPQSLYSSMLFLNLSILKITYINKMIKLQSNLINFFPYLREKINMDFVSNFDQSEHLPKTGFSLSTISEKDRSKMSKQSDQKLFKLLLELKKMYNTGQSLFQIRLPGTSLLNSQLQQILLSNNSFAGVAAQSRRKLKRAYLGRLGFFSLKNKYKTSNSGIKVKKDSGHIYKYNSINNKYLNISFQKMLNRKGFSSTLSSSTLITQQKQQESFETKFLLFNKTTNGTDKRNRKYKPLRMQIKSFFIKTIFGNGFLKKASLADQSSNNEGLLSSIESLAFFNSTNCTLPKIASIELISVRTPNHYAVCFSNFIVEKLEKRFSFRGTMKKAKEQAMKTPGIKGIKIQVAGRLNGAEIARTEWIRAGRVPLQTLKANIDYSYKTAKTIYGILGVKVWIFKESIKKL